MVGERCGTQVGGWAGTPFADAAGWLPDGPRMAAGWLPDGPRMATICLGAVLVSSMWSRLQEETK